MLTLEVHGLSGPICSICCQRDWVGWELKDDVENATQGPLLACDLQLALGERHIGNGDLLPADVNCGMILSVTRAPLPESPSLGAQVYREAAKRRWRGFDVGGFERDLAEERGLEHIGTETEAPSQFSLLELSGGPSRILAFDTNVKRTSSVRRARQQQPRSYGRWRDLT